MADESDFDRLYSELLSEINSGKRPRGIVTLPEIERNALDSEISTGDVTREMARQWRPRAPMYDASGRKLTDSEMPPQVSGEEWGARQRSNPHPYAHSMLETLPNVLMSAPHPAGPAIGGMIKAAPRAAAGIAGALAFLRPEESEGGGGGRSPQPHADNAPGNKPPDPESFRLLLEQQQRLGKQAEQARGRREIERQTGEKTRFKKYDDEYNDLNNQLQALNKMVEHEKLLRDPAYQIELKKKADIANEEARKRKSETEFKEINADWMPYVPYAAGTVAFGGGAFIKGMAVKEYNKGIGELANRWKQAVETNNGPLAKALMTEFEALKKAGPGGGWPAIGAGVGIGELSQIMPYASDYAKAVMRGELLKKVKEEIIPDSWDKAANIGGRMFNGALIGGIPAKIGSAGAGAFRKRPVGYRAETSVLTEPTQPPGPAGPGSGPSGTPPPNPPTSGTPSGPGQPGQGGPGTGPVTSSTSNLPPGISRRRGDDLPYIEGKGHPVRKEYYEILGIKPRGSGSSNQSPVQQPPEPQQSKLQQMLSVLRNKLLPGEE